MKSKKYHAQIPPNDEIHYEDDKVLNMPFFDLWRWRKIELGYMNKNNNDRLLDTLNKDPIVKFFRTL